MEREIFNRAIEAAKAAGNTDLVASRELLREYFTNPGFRKHLEDFVWSLNAGAKK